jgi:nucleoside-diphosphate-sugar epimerase
MAEQVLVTGGLGYLGSILCEHLLRAGFHVTGQARAGRSLDTARPHDLAACGSSPGERH